MQVSKTIECLKRMKECSTERPTERRKGKVPEMDKFVQFLAGIRED